MVCRLKYLLKGILLFLIMLIITIFQEYKWVYLFKLLIFILVVIKWSRYIKQENRKRYFKEPLRCICLYWIAILMILFVKTRISGIYFMLLSAIVYIIALIRGYSAGRYYLKIINKYYPDIMKEYYFSKAFLNKKVEKLENKLLELKESASPIVVEAIIRREMIKPIVLFHLEIISLTLIVLWPSYLY